MNKRFYIALLIIAGIVFPALTVTAHYTSFNYSRDNGFPGNQIYGTYQDSKGYIWIGTENGLVCFNGYAFKTYAAKDGLPDNEIFLIKEDEAGRLWMIGFANEICYLWRGKIYSQHNDSFLHKLSLASVPTDILFDRWGNTWIEESGTVIFISSKKEIKRINHIGKDIFGSFVPIELTDDGVPVILNGRTVYRYNKDHFELIGQAPILANFHPKMLTAVVAELSWTPFELFVKRLIKGESIYWKLMELQTINSLLRLSPDLIGMGTRHGAYLKDIKTGKIADSFLNKYNVSTCMIAKDSSLWFGTLGGGLFHFSHSFIRSIPVGQPGIIRFIKAKHDGLHFISGESTFVKVQFNAMKQPEVTIEKDLNGPRTRNVYSYIGQDHYNKWITCEPNISKYSKIGSKEIQRYFLPGCKTTFEEDDTNLLLGSTNGIFRLNKDKFIFTDTLYNKRVTSLAKIDSIVYAGTLTGLVVCYPNKKNAYLLRHPLLNRHITALCADNKNKLLWVASNRAILTGIYKGTVTAIIDENKGLICNSISALISDSNFLWVGTDNGLFVFNKNKPYNIIRHLSFANGLKSDQITYLDHAGGRIYVGTDKGLNYFETSEIAPLISKPAFIITNIQDGEKNIIPANVITFKNKTLKINFDVIDHSGIARPKYSYRLKDGGWTEIGNNELYFPTVPYGNFIVQIRALSPNWDTPKIITLRFSHASRFIYITGLFC